MPQRTVLVGVLLVILGVGASVGTGFESPTAVLPAALGVPVAVLGWLASEERRRAATMHAAVVLTLQPPRPVALLVPATRPPGTPPGYAIVFWE